MVRKIKFKINKKDIIIILHESLKSFQSIQILLSKFGYNYLKMSYLNGMLNKISPYYIFYHLKELKKIKKIPTSF